MKTGNLLLTAALGLTLCAAGWLVSENNRLRDVLASIPPPAKLPARKTAAAAPVAGIPAASTQGQAGPGQSSSQPGAGSNNKAASGSLVVSDNGNGTFTVSDAAGGWQRVMTGDDLRKLRQEMDATLVAATTKLPGGPSWSPGQAAGAPNTAQHGDYSTAWASQSPDGGKEWLQTKYARPVEISEINIHETYHAGAISKVSALMPDGKERVIWEGTMAAEEGVVERAVKVPPGVRSDQIRIELDTSRVPGWNEIDAVELVGTDGSRQWASESTASSYFGAGHATMMSYTSGLDLEYDGLGVR